MKAFDRDTQVTSVPAKLIAAMERVSTVYKSLLQEQAVIVGLSSLQLQILTFVAFQDMKDCTTTGMSEEMCMTKGTVSESLRVLVKKGMIVKQQSVKDSRSFFFRVTQEGLDTVEQCNSLSNVLLNNFSNVETDKLNRMWLGLSTLLDSLYAVKGIPSKMCYSCKQYKPLDGNRFRCQLLGKNLSHTELRIDCKEHEAA